MNQRIFDNLARVGFDLVRAEEDARRNGGWDRDNEADRKAKQAREDALDMMRMLGRLQYGDLEKSKEQRERDSWGT